MKENNFAALSEEELMIANGGTVVNPDLGPIIVDGGTAIINLIKHIINSGK